MSPRNKPLRGKEEERRKKEEIHAYRGADNRLARKASEKGRLGPACRDGGDDLSADPPSAVELLRRTGASAKVDVSPINSENPLGGTQGEGGLL